METQALLFSPEHLPPRVRYERLFSHLVLLPESAVRRMSAFLRDTPHEDLQVLRRTLRDELFREGVVRGRILTLDSCPIVSAARENNLKTSVGHNRFDKTSPPSADPEAGLGVMLHYPPYGGPRARNRSGASGATEIRRTANPFRGRSAVRRTEFDAEDLLDFIVHTMKATPVIPRNSPYGESEPSAPFAVRRTIAYPIQGREVHCPADLPMVHKGKMTVKATGITYRQYACPLHWRKKTAFAVRRIPAHPPYGGRSTSSSPYGERLSAVRRMLLRLTPTVRSRIRRTAKSFKAIYHRRPNVERVFSRLLAIAAQEPTVRGLAAVRNPPTGGSRLRTSPFCWSRWPLTARATRTSSDMFGPSCPTSSSSRGTQSDSLKNQFCEALGMVDGWWSMASGS